MCDSVSDMPGGGGCGNCSGSYGHYDSGDMQTTNSWDNYDGPTYSHDDRNPSGSSNNGNTPPNSSSNCTGLNTNHVTCTISDVYGGTPPPKNTEEEEEGSSAKVSLTNAEFSTGGAHAKIDQNGYDVGVSTPYAEATLTVEGQVQGQVGPVNIDASAKLEVSANTDRGTVEFTDEGVHIDIKNEGVTVKPEGSVGVSCFIETAQY